MKETFSKGAVFRKICMEPSTSSKAKDESLDFKSKVSQWISQHFVKGHPQQGISIFLKYIQFGQIFSKDIDLCEQLSKVLNPQTQREQTDVVQKVARYATAHVFTAL